jgi:hypothetical protein
VWPREIPQFSTQNLKHHPGSELGVLEVEFRPLPVGKPNYGGFGGMWNLILPNFKKKVPQYEFICKNYDRFTEARLGYGSERQNMTQNRNQVRQKLAICDGKGWSNGLKGSNRVSQWI